jgi:hypothetical protein
VAAVNFFSRSHFSKTPNWVLVPVCMFLHVGDSDIKNTLTPALRETNDAFCPHGLQCRALVLDCAFDPQFPPPPHQPSS